MPVLFSVKKGQEELSAIGPSGFVNLDNQLEVVNYDLRLLSEGV